MTQHLIDIDREANERIDLITSKLVKAEGVTEKLKATDQMEWARRMSSICDRAEEVVLAELIYC